MVLSAQPVSSPRPSRAGSPRTASPAPAVTLLVGDEGIGKSLLWVWVVAAVTIGKALPEFGIPACQPSPVTIVVTEDGWQDMIGRELVNGPSRAAGAHYAVHHRGHPFRHKAGDLTGVSTDHLREVRIVGGLLSDDTRWGKSELATVPARVPEEGSAGSGSCTSAPSPKWEYMLGTCVFNCAARSGEFDSVVVGTPPGISSTVRLISLWRANMSI